MMNMIIITLILMFNFCLLQAQGQKNLLLSYIFDISLGQVESNLELQL